ncbi:hypothetical protein H1R20_g3813, partial [Candolleomyces eurysporus]
MSESYLTSRGFTYLSHGAFGDVYAKDRVAFKLFTKGTPEAQREEYKRLEEIHSTFQRYPSLFQVPAPLALKINDEDPNVPEYMLVFRQPSMAMELLNPIPKAVGRAILEESGKSNETGTIKLCQICFRQPDPVSNDKRKSNLNPSLDNFPLKASIYMKLVERFPDQFTPLLDVARSMGARLADLHWKVGILPHDIEFVMSGASQTEKPLDVGYYIIDFGLVEKWNSQLDGSFDALLKSFFIRNLWCPSPIPGDALYEAFKGGYTASCPDRTYADKFFKAIEERKPIQSRIREYVEDEEEEKAGGEKAGVSKSVE